METLDGKKNSPRKLIVADRVIGEGNPCFLIAEAGVNHNGDLDLALRMIDAAADAGADAVKFQTFRADRLVTAGARKARYQESASHPGESQLEMLRRLELSEEMHPPLVARCSERGVVFLSTPFDEESALFLETLGVPAFKVGSGDLTNLPFLGLLASLGRPMIVSTGMGDHEEVRDAVETIRSEGNSDVVLLHCVSNYPANPRDVNLRAMTTLRDSFGTFVGFSDHTEGFEVALAAVALGASVVEKHFTLDRSLPGPDQRASMEPQGFRRLVEAVRLVESCLGDGVKRSTASEAETAYVARKSLVALRALAVGETLDLRSIGARRPGGGIPPSERDALVGRRVTRAISAGEPLSWEMID